jgi:hypothetical protein
VKNASSAWCPPDAVPASGGDGITAPDASSVRGLLIGQGQGLAKSKLTTAEMRRLRSAGIKLGMIARLAGITPNGVRNRLRSKSKQKRKSYRSARLKKVYLSKQKRRQRQYQRQSLKHAVNFGEWTPAEIRYLEKYAPELTRVEIAISLQRTFYSVSHYIHRHGIKTRK